MSGTRLERLSAEDARILALETTSIAGHTCKVVVVEPGADGPIELEELRAHVAARLDRAPRCRQRVARVPLGLAPPAWVDDAEFDIARHVCRHETSGVVSEERFRRIAGELMGTRLDHTRPLWRIDLVAPLEGGRAGIVVRIHHAMADGISALRVCEDILWDSAPDPPAVEPAPWSPDPGPSGARLLAAGLADRAAGAARGVAGGARTLARPRRIGAALREAAREPGALIRELRPLGAESELDARIGPRRELAFAGAALDDLKRVERAVGERIGRHVTINDVALAAVAGGLRRWLRGAAGAAGMRAQVPVSMHRRDETADQLSNRDSFLYVDLPVAEPDPLRRLELINAETVERKDLHDADALYAFFHRLSHMGPVYREAMRLAAGPREFSLAISNVPGPREPVFVLGRRVSDLHSIAEPADRHALRVSAVSLAGTMHFSLCTDPDALSDVHRLARGIERSVEELLDRV
ncbi:MAG TPA: wax ester/triacylglycerol synthase family O-acyltransferase [Solirubrobacterales bacterium]|nr:wax ester/triacylglycerol synthase family O-acyltransferase [Solirubrobacterales bacterium]